MINKDQKSSFEASLGCTEGDKRFPIQQSYYSNGEPVKPGDWVIISYPDLGSIKERTIFLGQVEGLSISSTAVDVRIKDYDLGDVLRLEGDIYFARVKDLRKTNLDYRQLIGKYN